MGDIVCNTRIGDSQGTAVFHQDHIPCALVEVGETADFSTVCDFQRTFLNDDHTGIAVPGCTYNTGICTVHNQFAARLNIDDCGVGFTVKPGQVKFRTVCKFKGRAIFHREQGNARIDLVAYLHDSAIKFKRTAFHNNTALLELDCRICKGGCSVLDGQGTVIIDSTIDIGKVIRSAEVHVPTGSWAITRMTTNLEKDTSRRI